MRSKKLVAGIFGLALALGCESPGDRERVQAQEDLAAPATEANRQAEATSMALVPEGPDFDTQMNVAGMKLGAIANTPQRIIELTSMPPRKWSKAIRVHTALKFDVDNTLGTRKADVTCKTGVSQPSEADKPMRPYLGWLHSEHRVVVLPGARAEVSCDREDVISAPSSIPSASGVAMPWTLIGTPHITGEAINNSGFVVPIANIDLDIQVTARP